VLQVYWSSAAGGASSHFTGQSAGMALFGYVNTFSQAFPYNGSGAKDRRDSTGPSAGQFMVDGGLTTQSPLGVHPATVSATYKGGLYIDLASSFMQLVGTILGIVETQKSDSTLRTIFNHDPELFYADRLRDFGVWTQPDGTANTPSRPLGSFVTALHGTALAIGGGYGSTFGDNMHSAYRGTSTYTG
jgi:hypothetical protein